MTCEFNNFMMASLQKHLYQFFFLLILFMSGFAFAQTQPAIPELWGMRVHDEAKVLSTEFISQLENQLKTFEDSTTNQVAVLVIQTLDGYPLESFGLEVADKWKLGTEKNDNGVLLLIVIQDRKMRIEVGQGLEGVLTDAATSRIIRNEIAPAFRRQDYEGGIQAGIDAIIRTSKGEFQSEDSVSTEATELTLQEKLMIGAFIFGILGLFSFFALFTPGCAGWGLYAFLIPFYAVFPMVVLGATGGVLALAIYALGMPILKMILPKTEWGKKIAEKLKNSGNSGGRGGGWSSGGGWFIGGGGSGGGWSSGGGGFSGGGGSFGGGGSSGSW
jgi:uncharacterized protein